MEPIVTVTDRAVYVQWSDTGPIYVLDSQGQVSEQFRTPPLWGRATLTPAQSEDDAIAAGDEVAREIRDALLDRIPKSHHDKIKEVTAR